MGIAVAAMPDEKRERPIYQIRYFLIGTARRKRSACSSSRWEDSANGWEKSSMMKERLFFFFFIRLRRNNCNRGSMNGEVKEGCVLWLSIFEGRKHRQSPISMKQEV